MRRILLFLAALAATLLGVSASAPAATSWLCKPGMRGDACAGSLRTTVFSPAGKRLRTETPKAGARKIDCFFVYPTTSDQKTPVATKTADPEIRSIALYQGARFTQHCRVFSPLYRQTTLVGLGSAPPDIVTDAGYADVREAWRTYLRRDNRGRGVVFLGHSQGSYVLRRLLREEVDPSASVRRRLVSALVIGGNVHVRRGSDRGGDFRNIRACRSRTQIGCVVAYSLFDETPPADALFGRTPEPNREVLCTNPAALGGGSGALTPAYPTKEFAPGGIASTTAQVGFRKPNASTPWISVPGAYRAACSRAGGASFLRVTPSGGAPDLVQAPSDVFGLHLADVNLALGTLVGLVGRQARAYAARR